MKAVVYTKYGSPDVLHIEEVKKPIPKDHEVLIKIQATSLTIGDTIMRGLNIPGPVWQRFLARIYLGILKPKRSILGMELAGVIESIGKDVTRFKTGDEVFASTFNHGFGAHAEYKCLPENGLLVIKPAYLSFEEAAAGFATGAVTALLNLKKADIQKGQKVLIYGASGSVGIYAIQLSKTFGAEVTGVCSGTNLDLVKSLGADHVVDYTNEDFTQSGERYDVIFDAVGKLPQSQGKKGLTQTGMYLNVLNTSGSIKPEHLIFIKELVEQGKMRAVIDRSFPFEQMAEAHRYVELGHKKGNVVITVTK